MEEKHLSLHERQARRAEEAAGNVGGAAKGYVRPAPVAAKPVAKVPVKPIPAKKTIQTNAEDSELEYEEMGDDQ